MKFAQIYRGYRSNALKSYLLSHRVAKIDQSPIIVVLLVIIWNIALCLQSYDTTWQNDRSKKKQQQIHINSKPSSVYIMVFNDY
jgi:hypothetical protein